ncbi:MAG: S1 RNA-binding domain-containing protein [Endomicrobium sp.]|jgi:small subunit ribosomal protein S1|nr:S1 RNA-binding domain-containing protein [Endomicrobium sp.]
MTENNKLDKIVTSFEDDENISMSDLMKNYDKTDNADFEKELEVTIIEENADGFMVDLRMKSEGIIPKKEFEENKVPTELKVGARVKVKILSTYGQPVLSYRKVIEEAKWDAAQEAFKNAERLPGTIIKTVKGGFLVDIGVSAFLHISQLDIYFIKETEKYVGKSYEFMITGFDRKNKKITVSRRKVIEDEKNVAKASALESIAEGQILDGTVSKITNFGAFINLGGIDGLLHLGDVAWHKIKKIEDLLHIGQTVTVQVLRVDRTNGKIFLSMKNLTPHPWEFADKRFPVGLIVEGSVTAVMSYGAFVELEPGINGLLHSSEYAWNDSEAALKKEVKEGQKIKVKIINVDKKKKKIALSVKEMFTNPWDEAFRHYLPGTVIRGIVQKIVSFGAFVKLPEGIEGLININNFSWLERVKRPEDFLKKGDEVEAVILEINPQIKKISLSLKHTKSDPYKNYKVDALVKGRVVRVTDFGAFVELESSIEALIKNKEMSSVRIDEFQSVLKESEEVEAKIIKVDIKNRKIELSIKKLEFDREKELIRKYSNKEDNPKLGDILTEE